MPAVLHHIYMKNTFSIASYKSPKEMKLMLCCVCLFASSPQATLRKNQDAGTERHLWIPWKNPLKDTQILEHKELTWSRSENRQDIASEDTTISNNIINICTTITNVYYFYKSPQDLQNALRYGNKMKLGKKWQKPLIYFLKPPPTLLQSPWNAPRPSLPISVAHWSSHAPTAGTTTAITTITQLPPHQEGVGRTQFLSTHIASTWERRKPLNSPSRTHHRRPVPTGAIGLAWVALWVGVGGNVLWAVRNVRMDSWVFG